MGIQNIQVLVNPAFSTPVHDEYLQALAGHQQRLVDEHRRGLHIYGNMRRECPLCQGS